MWTSSGLRENWKIVPYMGPNRFYEHAQNLLGGVKKEVGSKRNWGQNGCYKLNKIK